MSEMSLTTLMVTHNVSLAILYGHRLVMLHSGKVIFDVKGDEKRKLTTGEVVDRFRAATGQAELRAKALLDAEVRWR